MCIRDSYLGLAQSALGDTQTARANLEKARELNPNFAPAEKALAELGSEG